MECGISQQLIDFAGRLADSAGRVVRHYFRAPLDVDSKADHSPVTIADREAEQAMRTLIESNWPEHGIVGEEFGSSHADAEHVWVLDPIDGTRAFITGKPMFGTLIALLQDGKPIIGVIDQPVSGERWVGATGRPTIFNGAAAATRRCADLGGAILNATTPDMFKGRDSARFGALGAAAMETHYGGDCYAYGLLASGFMDIIAEADLKPYDFCALIPVVEGAGGIITDWQGRALDLASDGRVIAAGDAAVHLQAVEILSAG
ncbi:MAG: histidinol-phosphatase [Alphaproteobacteria bacterium]